MEATFAPRSLEKLRNRANAHDRPTVHTLRHVQLAKPGTRLNPHQCSRDTGGHDHRFQVKDNYGCCSRCGDEVLT